MSATVSDPWAAFRSGEAPAAAASVATPEAPKADPWAAWRVEGAAPAPAAAEKPAELSTMGGMARNLLAGASEHADRFLGLPVDVAQGAINLIPRGINAAAGTKIPLIEGAVGGSDWWMRNFGNPQNVPATGGAERVVRSVGGALASIPTMALGGAAVGAAAPAGSLASAVGQNVARMPIGSSIAPVAAGAAAGTVASDVSPDWAKPYADLAGNILGGGAAMGLQEAIRGGWNIAGHQLGTMGLASKMELGGQRVTGTQADMAAQKIAEAAGPEGRQMLRNAPEELVPGSQPTTAQMAPTPGLVSLEQSANLANRAPFAGRQQAQNNARVAALQATAPAEAVPGAVGTELRGQQAALEQSTARAAEGARTAVTGATDVLGGRAAPEAYGAQIRGFLQGAYDEGHPAVTRLWQAINPEGKLTVDVAPLQQAAKTMAGEVDTGIYRRPKLLPEEQHFIDQAAAFPSVIPFRDLQNLRSDLLAAERAAAVDPTKAQSMRRLGILKSAIDDSMAATAENAAAQNTEAGVRVRTAIDGLGQTGANDIAGTGAGGASVSMAPSGSAPGAAGAANAAGGGPGGAAGNQGVSGSQRPVLDALDQEAANAGWRRMAPDEPIFVGQEIATNPDNGRRYTKSPLNQPGIASVPQIVPPQRGVSYPRQQPSIGADLAADARRFQAERKGIRPPLDELSPNFTPENAAAYAQARAATLAEKQTFRTGRVGDVLRPGPGGTPYSAVDAEVPRKFFSGSLREASDVKAYIAATGGRPEAVKAGQDYLASELRTSGIIRPDGTMDPNAFARWQQRRANTIDLFPELKTQFATADAAQRTYDQTVAAGEAAVKAFQDGVARNFINDEPMVAVRKAFADNSATTFKQLTDMVKGNPDATEGLKRAVTDYIAEKMSTATPSGAGEVDFLKSDTLRRWIRTNRDALRSIYGGQGMQNIEAIGADLRRAAQRTNTTGGSDTAQKLYGLKKEGLIHNPAAHNTALGVLGAMLAEGSGAGQIESVAIGAGLAGAGYLQNALRQKGIQTVNDLIATAMLHPEVARELLQRVPADGKIGPVMQRRLAAAILATSNAYAQERAEKPH